VSSNTIEILIKATDKATGVIGKATGDLRNQFDSLGKAALKVGAGAALGGITALGAGLGLALSEAMEAEVNIAKLEAVLKATGGAAGLTKDEVLGMADSLSTVTRFSDDAILAGQTMLLTFTNIGEDTFPRATETMLDMAEMFGGVDAASVMLGKALNDPIQGVTALRRVGVQLTDAQEDMIKAMVESGDVAGAQTVILDELNREFGGIAKAAGQTLSGKLTILKNKFLNVAEAAGMRLLPVLSSLIDRYLTPLVPKIERVVAVFGNFIEMMSMGSRYWAEAGEALGFLMGNTDGANKVAFKMVQTFWDVVDVVKNLAGTIGGFISEHSQAFIAALAAIGAVIAGAAIAAGITAIAAAVMGLLSPLTLVIGAIALLAAAWAEDWGGIRTFVTDSVWPLLKPIFEDLKLWLEDTIPKAIDALETAFTDLKTAFDTGGLGAVGELILESLETGLGELSTWALDNIVTPIVATLVLTDWGEVGNTLQTLLEKFLGIAGSGLTDLGTWILDKIVAPVVLALAAVDWSAVGSTLLTLLEKFLSFAGRGLASMGEFIYQKIIAPTIEYLAGVNWSSVGSTLLTLLEKFLSFAGRGLASIGEFIYQKIIQPTIEYLATVDWGNVGSTLLILLEKLLGVVGSGIEDIGAWAYETVIAPIVAKLTSGDTYTALWESAKQAGSAIFDAIIAALGDLPNELIKIINDAIPNHVDFGSIHVPDLGPLGGGYDVPLYLEIPDSPIPHLGTGAIVTSPTLALLGEIEPEAVIPLSRLNGGGASGGRTLTINTVNVYGVQNATQLLDQLEQEARRRNRRLTTSMAGG